MIVLIIVLLVFDIRQLVFHWDIISEAIINFWNKIKPFLTWRIIICYLPWWFLATGWAWVFSVIGQGLLQKIAIAWLAFMWLPWSEEKLITIPLTIWLHKKLFPKHSTVVLESVEERIRIEA